MFQNKNSSPLGRQPNTTNAEPEIENVPVHTMSQDLAETANPSSIKINTFAAETAAPKKPLHQTNLTATQKSSPFLNPTADFSQPEPPKPEPLQAKQPSAAMKSPVAPITKAPSEATKSPFMLIVASLLLALIAGGGYYFWTTRQADTVAVVDEIVPPVETISETIPEPEPETTPTALQFSIDKPNYLNIENKNTPAGDNAKDLLAFYANQVSQADITTPVEFVVVDDKNNPLPFSEFAAKLGIPFTKPLSENLKDSFSLFIYNDGPLARIGLSLDSKDATKLKSLMSFEEKTLAKELEAIFLSSNYTLETKSFGSSVYNAMPIRYTNIVSPEDLSVDYAISTKTKKLLIGTTKMTLRSIIDYIGATTQPTATTATSPISVVEP